MLDYRDRALKAYVGRLESLRVTDYMTHYSEEFAFCQERRYGRLTMSLQSTTRNPTFKETSMVPE
jgi:hypothetical protein